MKSQTEIIAELRMLSDVDLICYEQELKEHLKDIQQEIKRIQSHHLVFGIHTKEEIYKNVKIIKEMVDTLNQKTEETKLIITEKHLRFQDKIKECYMLIVQ